MTEQPSPGQGRKSLPGLLMPQAQLTATARELAAK